MVHAGLDEAAARRRQAEGFAAERWLATTVFKGAKVLNRKGPGDIAIPATGEIIEVKSVPIAGAKVVNAGDKPPKYRTVVVVTEGSEDEWFVLGQIDKDEWVHGRPGFATSSQLCWYATRQMITCLDEWGCRHG